MPETNVIPILFDHDQDRVIGWAEMSRRGLVVEFAEPQTREVVESIFGNAGWRAISGMMSDPARITHLEVLEWSYSPLPGKTRGDDAEP